MSKFRSRRYLGYESVILSNRVASCDRQTRYYTYGFVGKGIGVLSFAAAEARLRTHQSCKY